MPTVVQDVSGDSALQTAIAALKAKIEGAEESSDIAQLISDISTALAGKQNTLTFDSAPSSGSTNPVTSGGVKTALDGKQNTLIFDTEPTNESTNPVTSGGVKEALDDMYSEITDRVKAAEEDIDIRAGAIFGSVSGSLVTITDGADDMPLKSCVVTMEPIQEGEGNPSPENVRPISGRTGLNLWRTKRNLLPSEDGSYKTLSSSSIYFPDNPVWLPTGTYYIGVYRKTGEEASAGIYLKIDDGSYNRIGSNISTQFGVRSFTLATGAFVTFRLYSSNPVGAEYRFILTNSLLTSGVDEFAPYQGNSYSVNWETEAGTMYGGTLDVVSGRLVSDKKMVVLNDPTKWWAATGTSGVFNYTLNVADRKIYSDSYAGLICTHYTGNYSLSQYCRWASSSSGNFRISDPNATLEGLQALSQSGDLKIVYVLAEPVEYQLTPQEVHTLLGENNIWSDGGDISVEYPADTKTYIDAFSIKTVEVSGQTPVIVAEENTRYICGEVTSLDFTPCESGICDIRFTAASISTVLTLPQTVKLPDWFDPTSLEANVTYEINIVDGVYGAVMSWA